MTYSDIASDAAVLAAIISALLAVRSNVTANRVRVSPSRLLAMRLFDSLLVGMR